jgi:hypothetical protein
MKQYWCLGQIELADYILPLEQPQWCVSLAGLFYRFLKHYRFIPDRDQWIYFCKLNAQHLLNLSDKTSSFFTHQESLADAENTIFRFTGINKRLVLLINSGSNIAYDIRTLYSTQILNKLQNDHEFIFVCFYYKNVHSSPDLAQGAHCAVFFNDSGNIILYDPNLGVSILGNSSHLKIKQEIHRFFSVYSESYIYELISNHLKRDQVRSNAYKLEKWQWRQTNFNNLLKYSSTQENIANKSELIIYIFKTSLDEITSNQIAIKISLPKFNKNEGKIRFVNYFNHYDNLKLKDLWHKIK